MLKTLILKILIQNLFKNVIEDNFSITDDVIYFDINNIEYVFNKNTGEKELLLENEINKFEELLDSLNDLEILNYTNQMQTEILLKFHLGNFVSPETSFFKATTNKRIIQTKDLSNIIISDILEENYYETNDIRIIFDIIELFKNQTEEDLINFENSL